MSRVARKHCQRKSWTVQAVELVIILKESRPIECLHAQGDVRGWLPRNPISSKGEKRSSFQSASIIIMDVPRSSLDDKRNVKIAAVVQARKNHRGVFNEEKLSRRHNPCQWQHLLPKLWRGPEVTASRSWTERG